MEIEEIKIQVWRIWCTEIFGRQEGEYNFKQLHVPSLKQRNLSERNRWNSQKFSCVKFCWGKGPLVRPVLHFLSLSSSHLCSFGGIRTNGLIGQNENVCFACWKTLNRIFRFISKQLVWSIYAPGSVGSCHERTLFTRESTVFTWRNSNRKTINNVFDELLAEYGRLSEVSAVICLNHLSWILHLILVIKTIYNWHQ